MDKINLKDILTGELTKSPFELDMYEKHDLVISLAAALATLQQTEYPDVKNSGAASQWPRDEELQIRHDEFSVFGDNFLQFLMNEDNAFSTELVITGLMFALRRHYLWFDSDTDAFIAFYKKYHMWIVSGSMDFDKPLTAEDYEKQIFDEGEEAKETSFGGNFTLRDHHISKEIHSRIDKVDKDQ